MDQIDLDIIAHLQKNGRKPFTDIAQALKVSEGTVRNRYAKLVKKGMLKVVGIAEPGVLEYDSVALIGIKIQPTFVEAAAESIDAFTEVSYLVMVSGEFDLFIEVMCQDRQHLTDFINQKLHSVGGIQQTQTFMILRTYKMAYGGLPPLDSIMDAVRSTKSS